uniref:Uncharacterized protein n=1 Tax=Rhabditophanes sp. KR3021 TaxID=114890 RepID=A0AC35TGJ5_9BILA
MNSFQKKFFYLLSLILVCLVFEAYFHPLNRDEASKGLSVHSSEVATIDTLNDLASSNSTELARVKRQGGGWYSLKYHNYYLFIRFSGCGCGCGYVSKYLEYSSSSSDAAVVLAVVASAPSAVHVALPVVELVAGLPCCCGCGGGGCCGCGGGRKRRSLEALSHKLMNKIAAQQQAFDQLTFQSAPAQETQADQQIQNNQELQQTQADQAVQQTQADQEIQQHVEQSTTN